MLKIINKALTVDLNYFYSLSLTFLILYVRNAQLCKFSLVVRGFAKSSNVATESCDNVADSELQLGLFSLLSCFVFWWIQPLVQTVPAKSHV